MLPSPAIFAPPSTFLVRQIHMSGWSFLLAPLFLSSVESVIMPTRLASCSLSPLRTNKVNKLKLQEEAR